jgi:Predicted sugar kinase
MSAIKRIGIVLKPHQPDALKTICDLTLWLSQKGIELAGGPEIERERVEHETGCSVPTVNTDKLAEFVDLILVLGGDGTMIATARTIGDHDVPVLGINYGGLGYLAEFRIEELYTALESILSGNLSARQTRDASSRSSARGEAVTSHRVLNDVVINKSRWLASSRSRPTLINSSSIHFAPMASSFPRQQVQLPTICQLVGQLFFHR